MAGARDSATENVVVPAIDAASSVACMRSLGRRGIETVAISEQRRPPGFSSRYANETIAVPNPGVSLSAYEDRLLKLARRPDITTIIPVREADIYTLARNKSQLSKYVATSWPSLEGLRRVQDRLELFDVARSAGVSVPETTSLDAWSDWSDETIIKPRFTVHAPEYSTTFTERRTNPHSTRYVPADEAPEYQGVVEEMGHVPLVQEYVPKSDEYAFFALYDHGDPIATFQHCQRRGWKYAGGPSAYRESVDIPALDRAGRCLLDELEWHGLAMVEFLRDPETGEFKLMEINPRFWTSLPFTIEAGVDFPYLYWRHATGRPIRREPDYDVGIGGHLLRGELLHLHSILTEEYPVVERPPFAATVVEIIASIVRHPRFDYASIDDPLPFFRDSHNAVTELWSGRQTRSRQGSAHDRNTLTARTPTTHSVTETIKSTLKRL